jgi:tRNA pseudouridine38-40 synthase
MSRRLKLIIAYDGAPFSGWQSQRDGNAVQDHLEHAFRKISTEAVRVHGAGRTDAGVHALAQCAHVDLTETKLTPAEWTNALNANLPRTIRILSCRYVSQNFHARFSAKGKTYRYRIWTGKVLLPLELGRVWHVPGPVDVDLVRAAASLFVGQHDFARFAANRGKMERDTIRTIRSITLRRQKELLTLEFSGDGFLYKMVRMIVGAIVDCSRGKISVTELKKALAGRDGGRRLVAPAAGLFLVRVRY